MDFAAQSLNPRSMPTKSEFPKYPCVVFWERKKFFWILNPKTNNLSIKSQNNIKKQSIFYETHRRPVFRSYLQAVQRKLIKLKINIMKRMAERRQQSRRRKKNKANNYKERGKPRALLLKKNKKPARRRRRSISTVLIIT